MKFNLSNEFTKMDYKMQKIDCINKTFSSRKHSTSNRADTA